MNNRRDAGSELRTDHARKRMQQRGIDELMVQLIETFGRYEYQTGGCEHGYLPKSTAKALRNAIDRIGNVSIIVAPEGSVITAFHKSKKIRSKSDAC